MKLSKSTTKICIPSYQYVIFVPGATISDTVTLSTRCLKWKAWTNPSSVKSPATQSYPGPLQRWKGTQGSIQRKTWSKVWIRWRTIYFGSSCNSVIMLSVREVSALFLTRPSTTTSN